MLVLLSAALRTAARADGGLLLLTDCALAIPGALLEAETGALLVVGVCRATLEGLLLSGLCALLVEDVRVVLGVADLFIALDMLSI